MFSKVKKVVCLLLCMVMIGSICVGCGGSGAGKDTVRFYVFGSVEQVKAEKTFGQSRFDFYFEKEGKPCFMEVKGVTLETDGICAFPDAPTERGAKHLRGLTEAAKEGYGAYVLFVIQMTDVKYLHPNDVTDPEFGKALREAAANGVEVLAVDCDVTIDEMNISKFVPVKL